MRMQESKTPIPLQKKQCTNCSSLRPKSFSEEPRLIPTTKTQNYSLYRTEETNRANMTNAAKSVMTLLSLQQEPIYPTIAAWHDSFLLTSTVQNWLLARLASGRLLTSHSRLPVWSAEVAPLGDWEEDGWPLLRGGTPFCLSLELESECSSLSDFALRNRPPAPLALFKACWCRDSWRYGYTRCGSRLSLVYKIQKSGYPEAKDLTVRRINIPGIIVPNATQEWDTCKQLGTGNILFRRSPCKFQTRFFR
jgi:hypothetical protein